MDVYLLCGINGVTEVCAWRVVQRLLCVGQHILLWEHCSNCIMSLVLLPLKLQCLRLLHPFPSFGTCIALLLALRYANHNLDSGCDSAGHHHQSNEHRDDQEGKTLSIINQDLVSIQNPLPSLSLSSSLCSLYSFPHTPSSKYTTMRKRKSS